MPSAPASAEVVARAATCADARLGAAVYDRPVPVEIRTGMRPWFRLRGCWVGGRAPASSATPRSRSATPRLDELESPGHRRGQAAVFQDLTTGLNAHCIPSNKDQFAFRRV